MPTPYPNPLQGLMEGFQGGYQMGLLRKQQRQAEQAALEKKQADLEAKKFEQGTKLLELGAKYRKFGPAYQEQAMQLIKQGGMQLGMPMPETMPSWREEFDEIGGEIELAIKGFRQFGDRDTLEKALRGAYGKASSLLEADELKALKGDTGERVKGITGEIESGMMQQALQIPGLAQQGVISPEQAEEGRLAALRGAGQPGVDVMKDMAKAKETKDPVFEQKLKRIQEAYGMNEQDAVGLATGLIHVVTDPTTGMNFLVNRATGTQKPLETSGISGEDSADGQAFYQPEKVGLYQLAEQLAGPIPRTKIVGSRLTGIFGLPVAGEDIEADQYYATTQRELVRALSINSKFPVKEMEWIKKEINVQPGFFDNPEALRARIKGMAQALSERLKDQEEAGRDRSLPVADRRSALGNAQAIRKFLYHTNAPVNIGKPEIATVHSIEDFDVLPVGAQFYDDTGNLMRKDR